MQILRITDGTTTIDLLDPTTGYQLASWIPTVSSFKDGGVWQESKIAEGRRPVMGVYGNAVETMNLWVGSTSQDNVGLLIHNLDTLLENAFAYFQPGSIQTKPIYLVAKTDFETNTRYAVICKGECTNYSDMYYGEFESGLVHGGVSKVSGFGNITLTIERGHWLSHAPGTGVQIGTTSTITDSAWLWAINTNAANETSQAMLKLANGTILSLAKSGQILATANQAASWSELASSSNLRYDLFQAANGDVYAGGANIYKSTNNGANFSVNYTISPIQIVSHFIQTGSGAILACGGTDYPGNTIVNGTIWRSTDNGTSWSVVLSTNSSMHLCWLLDDGTNLWAVGQGPSGSYVGSYIFKSTNDGVSWTNVHNHTPSDFIPCIRKLSDGNLYFISKWSGISQQTYSSLWWSIDGGLNWTEKSSIATAPISNIIELADNTLVAVGISYYSELRVVCTSSDFGYGWSLSNWDVTADRQEAGVIELNDGTVLTGDSTNIIQGTETTVTVTGSGLINRFTDGGQTSFPFVEIDSSSIKGDLFALSRILLSAVNGKSNRAVVGLRQTGRGSGFTPYLNISDVGNFAGINASAPTGSSSGFISSSYAPSGRCGYSTVGEDEMITRFIVSLSPTVAPYFYGIYRAFLRCTTTSTLGDIGIKLQVATGSGGVTFTSDTRYTNGDNLNYEVIDFGQISLPASGVFKADDIADTTEIRIQAGGLTGSHTIAFYDLIIIPTDEWSGDFMDKANEDDSDFGFSNSVPKLLDIDSLTDPRNPIKAVVRRQDNNYVTSKYKAIGGPAILRPSTSQRLWFFFMQTSVSGTTTYAWTAPPTIRTGINVYAAMRYKLMRGNL